MSHLRPYFRICGSALAKKSSHVWPSFRYLKLASAHAPSTHALVLLRMKCRTCNHNRSSASPHCRSEAASADPFSHLRVMAWDASSASALPHTHIRVRTCGHILRRCDDTRSCDFSKNAQVQQVIRYRFESHPGPPRPRPSIPNSYKIPNGPTGGKKLHQTT